MTAEPSNEEVCACACLQGADCILISSCCDSAIACVGVGLLLILQQLLLLDDALLPPELGYAVLHREKSLHHIHCVGPPVLPALSVPFELGREAER